MFSSNWSLQALRAAILWVLTMTMTTDKVVLNRSGARLSEDISSDEEPLEALLDRIELFIPRENRR